MKIILALDQGTSSTKAVLFGENGKILGRSSVNNDIRYWEDGRVEQDPVQLVHAMQQTMAGVISQSPACRNNIAAIGISVQTGAFLLWEKETGIPLTPVIGWQDQRGEEIPDRLAVILKADPALHARAQNQEVLFGTMETWLIYNLTNRKCHATDITNADISGMYDAGSGNWNRSLLDHYHIPAQILPPIRKNDADYGIVEEGPAAGIPICGVIGDSSAALFGEGCWNRGDLKITYGTGVSVVYNLGSNKSPGAALAWDTRNGRMYIWEGTVPFAGAQIQKLIREGIVKTPEETAELASSLSDNQGIYLTSEAANGTFPKIPSALLARAVLESIAYQVADLKAEAEKTFNIRTSRIQADGGVSNNQFLMQFQSDLFGQPISRNCHPEISAYGAACVAAVHIGLWTREQIQNAARDTQLYTPRMPNRIRNKYITEWKNVTQPNQPDLKQELKYRGGGSPSVKPGPAPASGQKSPACKSMAE